MLGPVDLEIGYGERVVIAGPNGSGKSTLLGALLGEIELTVGTQWRGPGVVVGRLEQRRTQLPAAHDACSTCSSRETGMTISEARTLLAKFGIVVRTRRTAASARCRRGSGPASCWRC